MPSIAPVMTVPICVGHRTSSSVPNRPAPPSFGPDATDGRALQVSQDEESVGFLQGTADDGRALTPRLQARQGPVGRPGRLGTLTSGHTISLISSPLAIGKNCCTSALPRSGNIDTLERAAGVQLERLVESYNLFTGQSFINCHAAYPADKSMEQILAGSAFQCKACAGLVYPDIVFFEESLRREFPMGPTMAEEADLGAMMSRRAMCFCWGEAARGPESRQRSWGWRRSWRKLFGCRAVGGRSNWMAKAEAGGGEGAELAESVEVKAGHRMEDPKHDLPVGRGTDAGESKRLHRG
ncbi:hypothetical protein HOY80DRAFT_1134070 [Tuber brumale]|nr:hypothetical protein HOY80DRAFT_1134070 [Tuber brumale]